MNNSAEEQEIPLGHFGPYGGRYVAETLISPLDELQQAWQEVRQDGAFQHRLQQALRDFVGRPTPLYKAQRLSHHIGGATIYLKREDLAHTGAHKINNTVGQALLAERLGKRRLIAETGAGQHGVATATVAAWLGLECVVYMGVEDMRRQATNVSRMKLLGAEVQPVDEGSRCLKDAMNAALRDWVTRVDETFYVIGTVAGPHPYPEMVRDFQTVIGSEAKTQIQQQLGRLPDALFACVGGGSNAMGLFTPFLADEGVAMYGVEAAGEGLNSNHHAATLSKGRPGVLHGSRSYLLYDERGNIAATHSISAGMDYPGVGPEHAFLKDQGRVSYQAVTDAEALEAFHLLSRLEGIMPALESSHALAAAIQWARQMTADQALLLCLSGRGDKDLDTVLQQQTTTCNV